MSEMIFLSHFYDENTPGYGGKKDFSLEHTKCLKDGHSCNQLKITLSNHVGTHIDTPFHFFQTGKTLSDYPANFWKFSKINLIDLSLTPSELITSTHIAGKINPDCDLLLLRTGFEKQRQEEIYWKENPGLSAELGNYLRENFPNIRAIGGDFISATSFTKRAEGKLAHEAFLSPDKKHNPILIIEDMKLSSLNSNPQMVIVAPLLILGADGSPVTVMAQL